MGQQNVNPVIIIAVIAVLVVGLGYFGYRAAQPPMPKPGSYTPGVPPWLDKNSPDYGKAPNVAAAIQKH
jgi:hypothetical protein